MIRICQLISLHFSDDRRGALLKFWVISCSGSTVSYDRGYHVKNKRTVFWIHIFEILPFRANS